MEVAGLWAKTWSSCDNKMTQCRHEWERFTGLRGERFGLVGWKSGPFQGSATCWTWGQEPVSPWLIPSSMFFGRRTKPGSPWWQSSLMLCGCFIGASAYISLRLEAGPRSNLAFCVVVGMSAITPTTCLCIMEMGAQRSSMSLHYLLRFRLACWEKPCKLSSRKCWRRLRKPGLNAWFTGNSAFAIPDKGNQLGDCSFREN